jgi:hypothetical protein
MVMVVSALFLATVLLPGLAGAAGAWLDGPGANWNQPGMPIPQAPPRNSASQPQCFNAALKPDSPTRQALVDAGWSIFNATGATGAPFEILSAQANADGMCRPTDYQAFVFMSGVFAGTLSPELMNSRTDGALTQIFVPSSDTIQGAYIRYTPQDPVCCPSAQSITTFKVDQSGASPVVVLQNVSTAPTGTASTPTPAPTTTATPTPAQLRPTVTIQVDDDAIDPGESLNVTVIASYNGGLDWIEWEGVKLDTENDNPSSSSDPELSRKEHDCNGTPNCANVWSVKPTEPGDYVLWARAKGEDGVTSALATTLIHIR